MLSTRVPGDLVMVAGAVDVRPDPTGRGGFRDVALVKVVIGSPEAPVRIRRS